MKVSRQRSQRGPARLRWQPLSMPRLWGPWVIYPAKSWLLPAKLSAGRVARKVRARLFQRCGARAPRPARGPTLRLWGSGTGAGTYPNAASPLPQHLTWLIHAAQALRESRIWALATFVKIHGHVRFHRCQVQTTVKLNCKTYMWDHTKIAQTFKLQRSRLDLSIGSFRSRSGDTVVQSYDRF